MGAAITGALLILLTAFPLYPGFLEQAEQSYLAPPIIDSTHNLYQKSIDLLPIDLPDLAYYPEQLADYIDPLQTQLRQGEAQIDFKALDGATCFVCYESVEFLGFLSNQQGSISPKFKCSDCGRTSDGCQTFQGHHAMYHECPVILGRRGYRFDCGIWSNGNYHRPTGTCPVCGESSY